MWSFDKTRDEFPPPSQPLELTGEAEVFGTYLLLKLVNHFDFVKAYLAVG